MCKIEREGRMPIIFDDDTQMFNNTAFIDELASLLRVGGYVPDRHKNVIIPMLIVTRFDYVLKDTKQLVLDTIDAFGEEWDKMSESEKEITILKLIH